MYNTSLRSFLFIVFTFFSGSVVAQIAMPGEDRQGALGGRSQVAEPARPSEYTIGGITISGNRFLDEDLLLAVTGLSVGNKVRLPGDENIARAIRNLWKQDLFSDVSIAVTRVIGDKVFLDIHIEERPRLSRYNFRGIKKKRSAGTERQGEPGKVESGNGRYQEGCQRKDQTLLRR